MGSLASFGYEDSIKQETDSVGGGFTLFPSAVHDAVIKMIYIQKSEGGATGLNCTFTIGDKDYKEVLWISNKEGKPYYIDKNSGEKKYLAGFLHADAIACLAGKKPLAEMETEIKLVKVRNKETKTDVPTKVEVLVELLDRPIKLGIQQQTVFKQEKIDGKYVDTAETRDENVLDKVFRASDNKTTAELRAGVETADFINVWKAKWDGQVKDRTKGKTPKGAAGKAGAPAAAARPTSNLFDD